MQGREFLRNGDSLCGVMSIFSWNIKALNEGSQKKEVKSMIKKYNVELFGLYETKIRNINFSYYGRMFGPHVSIISNRVGDNDPKTYSIWLGSDSRLWDVGEVMRNAKFIQCKARNNGGLSLFITMVYGSSAYIERKNLFVNKTVKNQ